MLMAHAIRCPQVAQIAIYKVQPVDFDPAGESEFQVIWAVAQAYWQAYSDTPPVEYMNRLSSGVLTQQGYAEAGIHGRMQQTIAEIYSYDSDWNVDLGKQLLNSFLGRTFASRVKDITATQPGQLNKLFGLIETEFQSRTIADEPEMDPFDLDSFVPDHQHKIPTNVPMLDVLLNGGVLGAECYGILGPSGGGKTTLAIQTAASLAANKQHVLYYTYEQPMRELQPRLLSCAARISREHIDNKGWDEIGEDIRKRLRVAADSCKHYLKIIDRSSAGDNLVEIEARIKRAVSAGEKPTLVIIDWMWILVTRLAAAGAGTKNKQERQYMIEAVDRFKSMAAEYNTSFMLLQQLSTEVAKKSPGSKPQWFNSAEAGNFAWLLAYCFAIGTADANGVCWMVGSKARNAVKRDVSMRLNGEYNRFDMIDTDMEWKKEDGKFVVSGEVDAMPNDDDDTDEEKSLYEGTTDVG